MLGAALLASAAAVADDIRTERVRKKRATSATVEDSIKGCQGAGYVLGAQKGQSMNFSMATDNTANYFSILAPVKNDEAMFKRPSRRDGFGLAPTL